MKVIAMKNGTGEIAGVAESAGKSRVTVYRILGDHCWAEAILHYTVDSTQ
jgi:hypothetical protein